MSEHPDRIEELEQANERLQAGLRQCHELVSDLRAKLAANANEPLPIASDDNLPDAVSD